MQYQLANFTIEGASVTAATLSADKKSATLEVSGLDYNKSYTVVAKNVVAGGNPYDLGSKSFQTPAVSDVWELKVESKAAELIANGADNTEVSFKLIDKATGQVDTDADNIVLAVNATYGNLAQKRVTIQNGVGTVILTSEYNNKDVTSKVDAQIIEASGDYKALIGQVAGETTVKFATTNSGVVDTVTLTNAESNQADRVTLFFDKNVSLDNFGKFLADGKYEYAAGSIVVTQDGTAKKVRGIKAVASNPRAIEVVLEKNEVLTDNKAVKVEVNPAKTLAKVVNSNVAFNLTDARKPEVTAVNAEGLNTVKVKFSEAVNSANFVLDSGSAATQKFDVAYGEFNPVTLEDTRDVVTLTLKDDYKEDVKDAKAGYFTPGKHGLQVSTIKDFAALTDSANVGSTQNLSFTVIDDKEKPAATVTVQSPEQFVVQFNKELKGTAADLQKVLKLQKYNTDAKKFEDFTGNALSVTQIAKSTYVVETTKDWTEVFNTKATGKNYYNEQFQIVVDKEVLTAKANGEKNEEIKLDLNYSGSPLATADTKSPEIGSIESTLALNEYRVVIKDGEPVKLKGKDNAGDTLNQDQSTLPETSVQFIGTDKDGKTVTVDGKVARYADSYDSEFIVTWAGSTLDPQAIVNAGGSENWTLVVKSLSDDVGNTVATLTKDFTITKQAAGDTRFYITSVTGTNLGDNNGQDVVTVTFSEGVQYKGGTHDAKNSCKTSYVKWRISTNRYKNCS